MASSMDKLAKELKKQMTASDERKPKPYDTQAEVLRVEDGVAWVHIPGGVDETPVRLTINAKKGDNVNLHVANGTAWITGNSTNPPTDDSTANYAVNISNEVKKDVTVLSTVVAENIEATNARFTNVEADTAKIHDLTADNLHATVGYIEDLTADSITANDISAASGYIKDLKADSITAQDISAASGYIKDLEAENITAQDITADHATIDSLDANYAHITDGVIDNAKIGYADVNNLSTNYAQINLANVNNAWIENGVVKDAAISDAQILGVSANKLTAGTIDASNITVTNLNASNITTGSITVDGITIDVENNEASIDGEYIEDGTITLNGLAQEVTDKIDGAIETFTGSAVPTLNNYPASSWTTTKIKDSHIGDVYYVLNTENTADGYCYRFAKDGNTYKWILIKDSDVTAALSRLTTAEGKISGLESFESTTSSWITNTDEELGSIKSNHTSLVTVVDKTVKETVQLWFTKANTTAPSKPTAQVTNNSPTGSNSYNKWNLAVPQYNSSYPNYYYCYQWKYVDGTYGWSAVTRDIAMGESQSTARTAASDASTAVSTAETASTNASNAVSTANTASTNASTALSTASTANTNASTALSTANTAASDASSAVSTANTANSNASSAVTTANAAQTTANANIKSSVQLWFTKANTTAPSKPTAHVTTNDASKANQWNIAVPTYNGTYPNYFYCYEYQKGDGTYAWSNVVYDRATTENQSNSRSALSQVATKVETSTFNTLSQTVDSNTANITSLSNVVETKADSSTVTTLSNTVNEVSQTATGNSSKISSLTNTLGTNADGTTKAGDIVHRTSAVEQDLSGFKTTVSKTYHKTSDFNTYKAANDTAVAAAKKAGDDAQADLDEYKGTVSETYATKSSLTQTAEGIRTDVSNTYETKTDASAKLTEAKGDATTKANKALTDAKADTTNKLKSYYTKTETDSAITQKAGEISLSVAQTEISKIEVGGRNLLKNSNDGSKYSWSQNNGAHSKTVDESGATFTITELPVSGSWGVFMVSDASLRTNILAKETYTLSFDIKTSVVISDISFGFNVREGNGANPFLNDHVVVVSTTANTWVHIVNTTTARDTLPSNSNSNLYITAPKLKNQLCSFSIKNVKVEKGNKATDWTPAPEDLENYADGAVNTAKAEIKVTTDSISTEVSKKVGNNEVISKINQSPEEITIDASRVNIAGAAIFSNYATTAQLNSEVNARKAVYATSSTAAGTKAKVADCSNFALYTGASVAVTFSNANTHATPTLNVNGTGAKNIKGYTGAALTEAEYKWIANSTVTFTYDGTNWRMQDGGALQAKAAAAASASIASTKASEASTSATNAATSASTASSKASEASTSATNAASSASTASSKASSASTSATNAATSASTASTKASEASTSATNAATSASTASTKASEAATSATAAAEVMGGFTILWNYENFSTANDGEGYICAFDPKTGSKSDANGWVKWNGTKRTISKQMINPNTILPYNIPIYVVCRLSSATATTGTNYLVWYKSGWKYAALPTPTAVGGDWTWTEATDIILGKFAEPSSEKAFTDCEIYNPPRSSKHITTNTVTAGSAQATANAAAPKSSAVAEEQYIYISQASGTASVSANTTWVTETGDKQNTWTTKRPTYNTTYPVLFIAKQKKVVSGAVTCTTPVKDDTTTVIDGGHISTGTIDASKATITNINASNIKSGTLDAARIAAGAITVEKIDPIVYKYSNGGRGTGYAKLCTISVTENYRNKPIQFTLHSRNKNATAVSWRFLNSSSPSTCTVSSATYDGDTPLYYVGTGGTYTIYFALGESYDEVRIYDLIIPYDTGLTVAWAGEYYGTSLPSGAVAFTKLAGTRTSAELDNAAKTATTYITHIDNNGIRVHPSSTENNSVVINASGMEVFKGGTTRAYSVAKYGDTARIGKESGSHLTLSPDSMSMSTGTKDVFNLLQKTMYIYWTRNYKGRQFANSTDRHVDSWETNTTVSTWDSIAVNYKLNNTSRTKKITSISNGVLANDEIYVHFNYSGTKITLTYGRGSSAASSDIIKLESAVVYYVTDEKLSQLHTGTYPNTTVSGALRIGNGTSDSNRINLMLVDWSGTGKFKGDILAFCGADSSGGMSLTKAEENIDAFKYEDANGHVYIDAYRVGRIVSLLCTVSKTASIAPGANLYQLNLTNAHLPKPLGTNTSGTGMSSKNMIFGNIYYNKTVTPNRYEFICRNGGSTAASTVSVGFTITYICQMDEVSGEIKYMDD